MARATLPDGRVLAVEREAIDATMASSYPDPSWRGPCGNGHEVTVETRRWVVDEVTWCPDCHDEHEEGHYECPKCGVKVVAPLVSDSVRRFVPGPEYWTLDGQPITRDEGRALFAAWQEQAP